MLAAQCSAAGPYDDFVIRHPGPCIRENDPLRLHWETGQRAFAEGAYLDARRAFLAAATGCPDDTAARHMAALASLALGDTAQAIRWLVQIERLPGADALIPLALASAYTNAVAEDSAIGWLKRGLQRTVPEERAYWVTRPAFAWLWSNRAPAFVVLLEEFGIPSELKEAESQAHPPPRAAPPDEPAPEPDARLLHLSYFDPAAASVDKVNFMRRQIEINMIRRIREEEAEAEEPWISPVDEEALQEP